MKTYIFKVVHYSRFRGYNRTIAVYRVKNNVPDFIGNDEMVNTASYKGDHAVACGVINDVTGAKMDNGACRLLSKNIQVFQV